MMVRRKKTMITHCKTIVIVQYAAVVVEDGPALAAFVRRCLDDAGFAADLGRRAAALVASGRGSTAATARAVLARLPAPSPPQARVVAR